MFSRFPKLAAIAVLLMSGSALQSRELRVCADPDNLPFSNSGQQGFENKIAELVAKDLGAKVTFVWQRMGRGFVREFMDSGRCEILIGIPVNFRQVLTTDPYYRSTYVFLVRRDSRVKPASLDDPSLRNLRIGVQALDEQYAPPGDALARRGLQNSLVPFYGVGNNANAIVTAVAQHKVDAAIVWGPLAGYVAKEYGNALEVVPIQPEIDPPGVPFTFEIAMGVQKRNGALREQLDQTIRRHKAEFTRILGAYGVPQLEIIQAARSTD